MSRKNIAILLIVFTYIYMVYSSSNIYATGTKTNPNHKSKREDIEKICEALLEGKEVNPIYRKITENPDKPDSEPEQKNNVEDNANQENARHYELRKTNL